MRNEPGMINSFDIDGVIYMGKYGGVFPGPHDIIITGRSKEEEPETSAMLLSKGISNKVYMNPTAFDNKSREDSGRHKGRTLFYLEEIGMRFGIHFEDDPVQAEIIQKMMPHIKCCTYGSTTIMRTWINIEVNLRELLNIVIVIYTVQKITAR